VDTRLTVRLLASYQDTLDFGAALCIGMLALACGLHVPPTTLVMGFASARGVLMASSIVNDLDLDDMMRWGKTMLVMPLACLKHLLSQAASATHEYEILDDSPSEARAIYAGKLKVSQPSLIYILAYLGSDTVACGLLAGDAAGRCDAHRPGASRRL
jgi:hypothetical protein